MSMRMEHGSSPYERGLAAFEKNALDEAIGLFTQAVEADDRPALAMSKRGVCKVRLGDRTGAAHDFAGALERDPRCTPALVNLGNLALEANMLQEARSKYEAALKIDGNSAMAHHNLGIVLRREGKIGESVREIRLAASLESGTNKLIERWKAFWRRRAQ
ncbi:MAG TPA: tetratricopeptide repeat protein [Candidatus Eremiobacteraceae bacterium]|nr:tetratricopeptide repeat protein [Candidatus Eremiobacteraceae bacterium]